MSADGPSADATLETGISGADAGETPKRKLGPARIAGLTFLFIFLVLVLTMMKLPQARITSLLQGYVQVALDPYGIYVTDRGRELSALHGFRYTLDHPTLEFSDQTRVELDSLVVTPQFLPLLRGRMGVNAKLEQGASSITLEGTGRGDKLDAKVDLDHLDLGKFGILAYAGGLKGTGDITGSVQIAGTLSDPSSLNGSIDLKLHRLKLDEQNLMGFQIPPLTVSEGTIMIDIQNGKLSLKNVQLGKGADDLVLTLTGDITLNRFMNSSALNLHTVFALSDKIKQSISLIDTLLGGAKMADGRYAFKITGTFASPFPNPDPTGTAK